MREKEERVQVLGEGRKGIGKILIEITNDISCAHGVNWVEEKVYEKYYAGRNRIFSYRLPIHPSNA